MIMGFHIHRLLSKVIEKFPLMYRIHSNQQGHFEFMNLQKLIYVIIGFHIHRLELVFFVRILMTTKKFSVEFFFLLGNCNFFFFLGLLENLRSCKKTSQPLKENENIYSHSVCFSHCIGNEDSEFGGRKSMQFLKILTLKYFLNLCSVSATENCRFSCKY
jgi:hypothetical protein